MSEDDRALRSNHSCNLQQSQTSEGSPFGNNHRHAAIGKRNLLSTPHDMFVDRGASISADRPDGTWIQVPSFRVPPLTTNIEDHWERHISIQGHEILSTIQ